MNNFIKDWFEKDEALLNIILSIDSRTTDEQEAAHLAFNEISEYLQIPKQPEECKQRLIDNNELTLNNSLFEELALINFMFPKKDIRGNVLLALCNLYHKNYTDYDEVAIIYFKRYDKIPDNYFIYFFGDTIDAKISFSLPKGKTWIEAGARIMAKILNN